MAQPSSAWPLLVFFSCCVYVCRMVKHCTVLHCAPRALGRFSFSSHVVAWPILLLLSPPRVERAMDFRVRPGVSDHLANQPLRTPCTNDPPRLNSRVPSVPVVSLPRIHMYARFPPTGVRNSQSVSGIRHRHYSKVATSSDMSSFGRRDPSHLRGVQCSAVNIN